MADNDTRRADVQAREADQSRERLASTIDDLQTRLNPRRLAGEAVEAVQERGAALAASAGEHKLALGLIGGAVGLLVLARKAGALGASSSDRRTPAADRRTGSDRRDGAGPDGDDRGTIRRTLDSVRSGVTEAGTSAADAAAETWNSARERTAELASKARYQAGEASRYATQNFDTNPLVGALVGLGAGALLGAVLPRTEAEDGLVGDRRDRFTDAARDAARAALAAGREALDGYGLSGDAAKDKLGSLKDHAAELARTVTQAASESFRGGKDGQA